MLSVKRVEIRLLACFDALPTVAQRELSGTRYLHETSQMGISIRWLRMTMLCTWLISVQMGIWGRRIRVGLFIE